MNLAPLVRHTLSLEPRPGSLRVIVGIAGAPGSGKTTLAANLTAALNEQSENTPGQPGFVHVPMDGFHLADTVLDHLGLRGKKGAPETFDVFGYLATLQRISTDRLHPVYVPGFERALEQPIAAAIAIPPSAHTIITEGNYLLLDRPGWSDIRPLCSEVWFCEQDQATRLRRLTERHLRFGKTPTEAAEWVRTVDEPNAENIAITKGNADLQVRVD